MHREAAKKVLFLVGSPLRGGYLLKKNFKKKLFVAVLMNTNPKRGGGLKVLVDCPLKKRNFLRIPIRNKIFPEKDCLCNLYLSKSVVVVGDA